MVIGQTKHTQKHFHRDAELDLELFAIIEDAAEEPSNHIHLMSRVRKVINKIHIQDKPYLLQVIYKRANGRLSEEEAEQLAEQVCVALFRQVIRQIDGKSNGLTISHDSESTFKWCCAKLGTLNGSWGMLANAVRDAEKTREKSQKFDEIVPSHLVIFPKEHDSSTEAAALLASAKDDLPPIKAWIVDLWLKSRMYGVNTELIIKLAYDNNLPRKLNHRRIQRIICACATKRGINLKKSENVLIWDLTYAELADFAKETKCMSDSCIQKLMAAYKKRVISLSDNLFDLGLFLLAALSGLI